MRIRSCAIGTLTIASLLAATAYAAAHGKPEAVTLQPQDMKFGPIPPSFPAGAQVAVLSGDLKKGEYTVRIKMPEGYKIPPHWHPAAEFLTVLSGQFYLAMGDKMDEAAAHALGPGAFHALPKGAHHSAWAKGATEIQVHGTAPFGITYVNASDDPRKKTATTK